MPPFDLVLCDAPCSGSGTWRRTPAAKWALSPERLDALTQVQDEVLRAGAQFVKEGGRLAYATCSVFEVENEARIAALQGWREIDRMRLVPTGQQDGFFLSVLRATQSNL